MLGSQRDLFGAGTTEYKVTSYHGSGCKWEYLKVPVNDWLCDTGPDLVQGADQHTVRVHGFICWPSFNSHRLSHNLRCQAPLAVSDESGKDLKVCSHSLGLDLKHLQQWTHNSSLTEHHRRDFIARNPIATAFPKSALASVTTFSPLNLQKKYS